MSDEQFICNSCQAVFSRRTHLHRHEVGHMGIRPYPCPFCNKAFSRAYETSGPCTPVQFFTKIGDSDSARRHAHMCSHREGRQTPPPMRRGRHRRSCDLCVIEKRACNASLPCTACAARGIPCTYLSALCSKPEPEKDNLWLPRPQNASLESHPYGVLVPREMLAADSAHPCHGYNDDPPRRPIKLNISYLLNFTNPSNNTLQEHFDSEYADHNPSKPSDSGVLIPSTIIDRDIWNTEDADFVHDSMLNFLFGPSCNSIGDDQILPTYTVSTKVIWRVQELASMLTSIVIAKSGRPPEKMLQDSLDIILRAGGVPDLVQSYFNNWYPHCPILHPPSFDPGSVHLQLLLTVLLIGALYLSREKADAARCCFDVSEELIFSDRNFSDIVNRSDPSLTASMVDIQIVQAALNMNILRVWDNHKDSRRRMRIHRYSDIITASRNLGIFKCRHESDNYMSAPSENVDWESFIKTEERIRLACYIFQVDSYNVIFHGNPPRISVAEMTGDIPCPEVIFLGHNEREALGQLGPELLRERLPKAPSLATSITLLTHQDWPTESICRFTNFSVLDLFMVCCGLLEMIYSAKMNCSLLCVKDAAGRALERWKQLWDTAIRKASAPELTGFFKHAHEYWILGKVQLNEELHPILSNDGIPTDVDSLENINDLLKKINELTLD